MQVVYNGITMDLVHHRLIDRRPVMSADGVEMLYMNSIHEFTTYYNPEATSYSGSPPVEATGNSAATTDASIRYALLEPRKQLLILADEPGLPVVLKCPAAGFTVDANNGPFPQNCTVDQITPKTWRVIWRVVCATIECGELDDQTPPIISNRWSQTQETGEDHRTTITTRGVTVLRTDQLANVGRIADYYRSSVVPGLPLSFKRLSINVNVSSAANVLVWQTVDREQFVSIGATDDPRRMGVVDFKAVFGTSSATLDGVNAPAPWLIGQFDAFAYGDANSSKAGMFAWLSKLAVERCSIPNGPVDPAVQNMILKVTTSESLHAPECELHITVQIPPAKQGKLGLGDLRGDYIGVDVINTFTNDGRNPQLPNDSNTRGTANAQALVAAIKEACSLPPALPYDAGESTGYPADNYQNSDYSVTVEVTDDIPGTYLRYSEDATSSGTYTEMSIESKWKTNQGVLQCPIGGSPPADSGDGTGDDGPPDCEFLTVSRPMTTLEVHFEAERSTIPPVVPDPVLSGNTNLVLLDEHLSPMAVGLAPDGQTRVYRIGGTYLYGAKKARKPGTSLPFCIHPFTDYNFSDDGSQFPQSSFHHGLIDDGSGDATGDGSTGDGPIQGFPDGPVGPGGPIGMNF